MAFINDLDIQISLLTRPLTIQGFGKPLVLGSRASGHALAGQYLEVTQLSDMTDEGFLTSDDEYLMIAAIFAQSPRPATVAVYIRSADAAEAASVTGDASLAAGHDWSGAGAETFSVAVNGGTAKTVTLDSACANIAETVAEINAGFTAQGIDGLIEAVADTNYVKLQTIAAGADKSISISEGTGALATLGIDAGLYSGSAAAGIASSLAALISTHNDWYGLFITERDKASLAEAGTWALSNEKMFIGGTSDLTALDGRNNIREAYLIHNEADTFPEAAWGGLCFPQPIGSITWKWKAPAGVNASNYTSSQLAQIRAAHGQTLSERSGIVYADEGITTGGEFIDTVMARDYIKARLGEELFAMEVRNGKIPFDNSGAGMIEAAIRTVLRQAGVQGIIARAISEADKELSDEGEYMYTVSVPERSEVPANDRAARLYSGISFSFTLAGAVHKTEITGTITI